MPMLTFWKNYKTSKLFDMTIGHIFFLACCLPLVQHRDPRNFVPRRPLWPVRWGLYGKQQKAATTTHSNMIAINKPLQKITYEWECVSGVPLRASWWVVCWGESAMISEDPGFQVSSHSLQSLNSWKRLQPQQSLDPLGNEHTVTGSPSESHVQWASGPYMITVWHYWGSSRIYFQYNTSVIFTSPEWFLLPNIKQKSKVQCFLLSKVSSFWCRTWPFIALQLGKLWGGSRCYIEKFKT